MGDYRYQLRKGSKKERCPQCGKIRFKPYIDMKTNKEAGQEFGMCDRIEQCGYKLYPKTDKAGKWEAPERVPLPVRPIDYVPVEKVEATFHKFQSNVFFMYLVKMFGKEKAFELHGKYNIGTAQHGGTIFWQQDRQGRFHTGKVMYYLPNGKRDKSRKSWFVHAKISPDFNYQQVFFGTHLVPKADKIALCESEKTAVLMSIFEPDYTWIASGGAQMLNLQRLSELPYINIVYPDNGQKKLWQEKLRFFDCGFDGTVDEAVRAGELPEGSDILDLYLLKNKLC